MTTNTQIAADAAAEQARFMTKVYGWMCLALVVTGYVALWTSSNASMMEALIGNKFLFYGLIIAEFICVAVLVSVVQRISSALATLLFLLYAAMNGFTFSVIFLVFTMDSIGQTFFITAGTFGIMSAYGYFTKRDLTSMGSLATMGLMGIVLASLVNLWLNSDTVYWVTTYIGVVVFVALTAYDTQKIKNLNIIGNEGTEEDRKESIIGALTLYLDFINLFLMLLRLFGRRR